MRSVLLQFSSDSAEIPVELTDKLGVEALYSAPELHPGHYLTLRVARVDFAVETSRVRGILPARDLKPVAPSPTLARFFSEWTCGFASLRGNDVPVIDLRARLNLPPATYGRHPCIIVVELTPSAGPRFAGFLADRVSQVVYAHDRDLFHGRLRHGERWRRVLDPDLLLSQELAVTVESHVSL